MLILMLKMFYVGEITRAKLEKTVIQVVGDLACLAKECGFSTIDTRRECKASEKRRGMGKVNQGDDLVGGLQNGFEERLEAARGYLV